MRRTAPAILFSGFTQSSEDADFRWLNIRKIWAVQEKHKANVRSDTVQASSKLLLAMGAAWITNDAVDFKLRLLTTAHAGTAGHQSARSTWHVLRKEFIWVDQRNDTHDFVSFCLLCVLSKSGNEVPRLLSTTIHGSRPNDVIHFEYVSLSQSDKEDKYALVVKNDLGGYFWLEPGASADFEHASKVLSCWTRVSIAPELWVFDQDSQSKNEVLGHFSSTHRIHYSLPVAYSPRVNGTVQSDMRSVLSATRAMLGELKLVPQDWFSLLAAIATALSEARPERLGRRDDGTALCLLKVVTVRKPKQHILHVFPPSVDPLKARTLKHAHTMQVTKIKDLQHALNGMEHRVAFSGRKRRKESPCQSY